MKIVLIFEAFTAWMKSKGDVLDECVRDQDPYDVETQTRFNSMLRWFHYKIFRKSGKVQP